MVREGWSWGAFLFGCLWLFFRGAFIAAALALLAAVLVGVFTSGGARIALELGIAFLIGFSGRDLVRWHLRLRGYRTAHVLAAHDQDIALSRLLAADPALAGSFMPPGKA